MREQLEIIEQGVETWNQWRQTNANVRPNFRGADLREANLHGADLSRANLRGTSLHGVNLRLANLSRTDLREADLREASLYGADLRGANLRLTNLREADLRGARFYEADLRGADIYEADLRGAHLRLTNLREADLRGADLSGANLRGANLYGANLRGANLYGADLRGVSLVKTNLKGADITRCAVYGVSVWNIELDEETIQKDLIISADGEPIVMVDDLEIAQFVYLLLYHDKFRNVLKAVIEKGVLILGRIGGGELEVLRSVADLLRDLGYTPIIFDFERPRDQNYTETIRALVGMVRFVIADLSGPSVPQELWATISHKKRPFVPILETGYEQDSLFSDLLENQNVFEPVEFESKEQLLALLPERIVAPAETYIENEDSSS